MYKIEMGVPIPPRKTKRKGSKYPFADLKINESFFIEAADDEPVVKVMRRIVTTIGRISKTLGVRFTVRSYDNGVRVWRVA